MTQTFEPFSRTDMLPPRAPPTTEAGILKWLRENLFSSVANSVLTVLGILTLYWLVTTSLPWWLNSVWQAGSLGECRDIVKARAGEGATGACWAMVRERWHQFIFGFYPPQFYWRPILAFGLLFTALAPVLFAGQKRNLLLIVAGVAVTTLVLLWLAAAPTTVYLFLIAIAAGLGLLSQVRPSAMLLFTALYPALCFWLLWGGSFWVVVSLFLAIAVGVVTAILFVRAPSLNMVFAVVVALGTAIVATSIFDFVDTVGQSMWQALSNADFYPGYLSENGPILGLLGAILSAVIWIVAWIAWAIIAVIRAVGWAANLDVSVLMDSPYASYLSIGSALAALGGYLAARNRLGGVQIFAGLVFAVAYWLFLHPKVIQVLSSVADPSLTPVNSDQFGGFLLSITIGVTAIGFSLPIGVILALGRKSDMLIVKALCVGFIEFIRGVPLITLLFTASLLLQYFLPPNTNFDIILRVIILVTLFAAAYLAEVIRGGLAALPSGQYEAADALGLDYWRAQRLIILPQALKISIPGIVSSFIGLFKDTVLVAFVGLYDPLKGITGIVRQDTAWKGIYWEPYIFVGAIFFVICFGMSRYSMYLEQKLKTDHR
jgi:His/Glu/Gln/Arg/opine family amino acid ABC transporter permease subunit